MRRLVCAIALLWMGGSAGGFGQTVPPESGPPGTRAVQLPLSGRTGQPGGVQTVQNPLPGGLQSVNTITSTVQVQGAYQGSIPSAAAAGPALSLSLDDAVRRGLEYNLGAVSNRNSVRQTRGYQRVERVRTAAAPFGRPARRGAADQPGGPGIRGQLPRNPHGGRPVPLLRPSRRRGARASSTSRTCGTIAPRRSSCGRRSSLRWIHATW